MKKSRQISLVAILNWFNIIIYRNIENLKNIKNNNI